MNTEHKQSINLSSFAETILQDDMELFAPEQTFTGFLNTVIERYSDYAGASIHSAILRQRARLRHALGQDPVLSKELDESQQERVTRLLDQETEYLLLAKIPLYPSGRTFTFRLNNRNYQHFFSKDDLRWPDTDYYGGYFSRYLKAVVEEYCSLPIYKREEIFFREHIETIETALDSNKMLRIEMQSSRTGSVSWDVRPFAILPAASHLYHYLVGKSVQSGGLRRDERIVSIRLSRIRRLTVLSKKTSRSGMLSAAEKKEIRQKIRTNSVAFLIGDEEEVIVRLTELGSKMYKHTLFMRPALNHIDDNGLYHFLCTQLQARRYFIRFGAEAEIISPTSLRKKFIAIYENASKLYLGE